MSLFYLDDINSTDYARRPENEFEMKAYSTKLILDYLGEKITLASAIPQSKTSKFSLILEDTFTVRYDLKSEISLLATYKNDFDIDFILKKVDYVGLLQDLTQV